MKRIGILALALTLVGIATAAKPAPKPKPKPPSPLLKLAAPGPGQVYLGLDYRLWDSVGPDVGDSRVYSARIADTIATELGGKRPAFLDVWISWGQSFDARSSDIAEARQATGPNGLLYLDWTLTDTTATNGPTTADIASGKDDGYIRTFAKSLAAYRKPVLIRLFGGEFNGSWWWGVSPLANPALTPATFVAAWQRVVTIARAAGARNVSWAWLPQATPGPVPWADADIAAYYPGDDYVDWAGADIYDNLPVTALDSSYAFATAHQKPFFIAEWGVRHPGSSLTPPQQRDWIAAMFAYIAAHPDIQAAAYFDYDNAAAFGVPSDPAKTVTVEKGVTYQRDVNDGDHRLIADSGAGWPALFAASVAAPSWLSSVRSTRP